MPEEEVETRGEGVGKRDEMEGGKEGVTKEEEGKEAEDKEEEGKEAEDKEGVKEG